MVNDSKKKSTGEELYLVHLKRQGPEGDDQDDRDRLPRKRSCSIGEELYSIHLKRSEAFDSEHEHHEIPLITDCTTVDSSDDDNGAQSSTIAKDDTKIPQSGRSLRNRVVPISQ